MRRGNRMSDISEHVNVNIITLKTPRDFRGLANGIEAIFERVSTLNYGRYTIEKEERYLFVMAENMRFFQEILNKGIRLEGSHDTTIIEIYDYKKHHDKMEKMLDNFNL